MRSPALLLLGALLSSSAWAGDVRFREAPVLPFASWDEYFFDPSRMDLRSVHLLGETLDHEALLAEADVVHADGELRIERDAAGGSHETWRFDLRDDHYELRTVERHRDNGDTSIVSFDPALPDLRYGAPDQPFRSTLSFASGDRTYRGEVVVTGDLRPDTARIVVYAWGPKRRKQPVVNHLAWDADGAITTRSIVLASGQDQLTESATTAGAAEARVEALAGVDFSWQLRPHRISHFELRVTGAEGPADPGWLRFEGGTWANGQAAVDQVEHVVRTRTLEGARFYRGSTPTFDLVQPVDSRTTHRYVKGIHETRIAFPPGELPEDPERIAVFVNGFAMASSYFHDDKGATVMGFGFDVQWERDGDDLLVRSTMMIGIDAVPERQQQLERYAAYATVNFVVALLDEGTAAETSKTYSSGRRPLRLFAPADPPLPCGAEAEIAPDFTKSNQAITSAMFWTQGQVFPGRFIRRLSMQADDNVWHDRVNNAGLVARAMKLVAGKGLVRLGGVEVVDFACYDGVGSGIPMQPADE